MNSIRVSTVALSLCALLVVQSRADIRILFTASPAGATNEIYSMNADGTDVRRLTTNSVPEVGPVVSPDGKSIACVLDGVLSNNIELLSIDGGAPRQLANINQALSVQWGSSNQLYYLSASTPGSRDGYYLRRIATNGTGATLIFPNQLQDYAMASYSFCVSIPSNRVYIPALNFTSYSSLIYTASLASASITASLAADSTLVDQYAPTLAPNGKRLAFCADTNGMGDHKLFVSGPGGGTATILCDTFCGNPAWSPDSAWLVFTKSTDSTYGVTYYVGDIYRVSTNGTGLLKLSTNAAITGTCAFPSIYNGPPFVPLASPSISDAQCVLTWTGGSGYVHTVQWQTNLLDPAWMDLPGFTNLSSGGSLTITNTVDKPAAFYRIQIR